MTEHLPDDGQPGSRRKGVWVIAGCFVVVVLALWLRTSGHWPIPMTVVDGSIGVDGELREYRLVIPDAVADKDSIPVVFALPGAIDTTTEMAKYTDLDRLAANRGFLLVYLQGRHLNWPPTIPPDNPDCITPDLRFFETMCKEMISKYHADPDRVYVVGVSQGGAMACILTAKCSHLIAATVCCCGWLPEPLGREPLRTQHKCPMLFIAGSQDRQIPPAMVRIACDAFARDGHDVVFRTVEGFGHGWPRSEEMNEEVWAFLSSHRRESTLLSKSTAEKSTSAQVISSGGGWNQRGSGEGPSWRRGVSPVRNWLAGIGSIASTSSRKRPSTHGRSTTRTLSIVSCWSKR